MSPLSATTSQARTQPKFRKSLNKTYASMSQTSLSTQSSEESLSALKSPSNHNIHKKRGSLSRLRRLLRKVKIGQHDISTAKKTSTWVIINHESEKHIEPASERLNDTLYSQGQPGNCTNVKLLQLPAEILLMITDYLPTSSSAALSLCCHTLSRKLGKKWLKEINNAPFDPCVEWFHKSSEWMLKSDDVLERQTFLEFLDKDTLELIYCYFCNKLHRPELTNSWRTGPYVYIPDRRPCAFVQAQQRPEVYMDQYFNFSQVQHVMKYHRAGRETSLLLKQMERTYTQYSPQHAYQRSTHFRISPSGHFLARTQHWIALKGNDNQGRAFPDYCKIELCPHYSCYGSTEYPTQMDLQIRCKIFLMNSKTARYSDKVTACGSCNTEYRLDSKQITDDTWALVYTVWQDFGECRNPFEKAWEDLALGSSACRVPGPGYRKSNIRRHFRDAKFDELISEASLAVLRVNGGGFEKDTTGM